MEAAPFGRSIFGQPDPSGSDRPEPLFFQPSTTRGTSWAKRLEIIREMQKIRPISLFCALAICLGAALGWGLRPSFLRQGKPVAQLWIPPDALNMGTIWEDDQFAWTVPIENHEGTSIE